MISALNYIKQHDLSGLTEIFNTIEPTPNTLIASAVLAILNNNIHALQWLISIGLDTSKTCNIILSFSIMYDKLDILQFIIDSVGINPLIIHAIAIKLQKMSIIKWLIANGFMQSRNIINVSCNYLSRNMFIKFLELVDPLDYLDLIAKRIYVKPDIILVKYLLEYDLELALLCAYTLSDVDISRSIINMGINMEKFSSYINKLCVHANIETIKLFVENGLKLTIYMLSNLIKNDINSTISWLNNTNILIPEIYFYNITLPNNVTFDQIQQLSQFIKFVPGKCIPLHNIINIAVIEWLESINYDFSVYHLDDFIHIDGIFNIASRLNLIWTEEIFYLIQTRYVSFDNLISMASYINFSNVDQSLIIEWYIRCLFNIVNNHDVKTLMSYMYLLDNLTITKPPINKTHIIVNTIHEKCNITGFKNLFYTSADKLWSDDDIIKYIQYIWDGENEKFIKALNDDSYNQIIKQNMESLIVIAFEVKNTQLEKFLMKYNIEYHQGHYCDYFSNKKVTEKMDKMLRKYFDKLLVDNKYNYHILENLCYEYYTNIDEIKKIYENIYTYNISTITYESLDEIINILGTDIDYEFACSDVVIDDIKYNNYIYN
jgi:hypothetical protein